MMAKLRDLPQEERPAFGALVNETKQEIENALFEKKKQTRKMKLY